MVGDSITIKVAGLKEMNKALRQLDKDAPKATKQALNGVADLLVQRARPKIPVRKGNAARSLRASSTANQARITAGGSKARYYAWLDFGGRTGIKKSVHRTFIRGGRYIYPTLADMNDEITSKMENDLNDVARSAGLEVS